MNRFYFVYSEKENKETDDSLLRSLHIWLPSEIDIVQLDLEGDIFLNRKKPENFKAPRVLSQTERPFCMQVGAYHRLHKAEHIDIELPRMISREAKQKYIKGVYESMLEQRRIVAGSEEISFYVEQLKKRGELYYSLLSH